MAKDRSLEVRRIAVTRLKASTPLAAIVAARVYGPDPPANPTWPFVRYGFASSFPSRATGLDGSRISVVIHGFARGPGEDSASALGAAITSALDGYQFEGADFTGYFKWTQTQLLRDSAEASDYHAACTFEVVVTS